jgi:hypothetical protein
MTSLAGSRGREDFILTLTDAAAHHRRADL